MKKTPGRKPYGSTLAEQEIIQLIKLKVRVRKGGKKPSALSIARELNEAGHQTRTGKLWRAQTVLNVLARESEADNNKSAKPIKKTGLGTGDYLSRQQLQKLFAAGRNSSQKDEMIIAVLIGAGLRASELCALQVRDLGIEGGKNQIDVRRGKGAKQRSIFISHELSGALREYIGLYRGERTPQKSPVFANSFGEPLSYDALYKRIKKMGRMAGIPGLHPHALRHTFGTLLYHYQKDLFFVREQLGHSSVDTTQIYAKTLTESKLEQMNAFGNELGGLLKIQSVPENASKLETKS